MDPLVVLALLLIGLPVSRWVLKALLGRTVAGYISGKAMAAQPDEIHLSRVGSQAWSNAVGAEALARPLLDEGFNDAGTCTVTEMPGVVLRMLANGRESFYAVIYEHPQAGQWMDLVTRYQDGTSSTFTSCKPTGLAQRPGHPNVHVPGAKPLALLERARKERPQAPMQHAAVDAAMAVFERAYAEETAWRKGRGVSLEEIGEVASRMEERDVA